MSTRDRIHGKIRALVSELVPLLDDPSLTQSFRDDLRLATLEIESAADIMEGEPTGPDHSDGGPTRDDLKGTVTHGS